MSGAPARRKSLIPLSGPSGAPVPEPDRAGLATPASAGRGRLRPQVTVTGARVDPRPLGDRHYMQACVRNLICYLSEHHFEHAISPKTLANPSAKDFQAIFTFLIRQLDPNFQWSGKFEDEVPQLLKRLQYPFTVSKSALYAVGSPHTWPTLLGCLTWLVELLVYDAEARVIKERETETLMRQAGMLEGGAETDGGVDLDEERAAASRAAADERLFFDYLTATYEAFLAGADDFDEFDRELDTALGSRTTHAESQVQELETRLATAKRHIEQLQSQSQAAQASLMSLAQKREDYSTDLEKFRKLIAQLESHKGMLERKCAERQTDLERKCAEHERLSAEVDALKERLARQQLNAVDVERIARKRRDLRANQDRVRQALTEAERKLKDAEAARDQVQSRVDDARRSLRGAAEGVGLSASTVAECLWGRAGDGAIDNTEAITQPKRTLQPLIDQLTERLAGEIDGLQAELLTLQEKIDAVEEQVMLRRNDNNTLELKHQRLESDYKAERETMASRLRELADEAAALQDDTAKLRAENHAAMQASQRAIEGKQAEWREAARAVEQERDRLHESLLAAVEKLTEHKTHIQETLGALREVFEGIVEEFIGDREQETEEQRSVGATASPQPTTAELQLEAVSKQTEKLALHSPAGRTAEAISSKPAQRQQRRQLDENAPPNVARVPAR
ncbi:hypothetical protein CDCA_CDCA14G3867 [Cyanidium caldarium]|uniref:Kinetochore protein NDC80 n=1 Tax=Cyanidium caldarium TaxID=2771 RepID=A0AAV9IZT1_CYACA|nr:hypothetical protein CDCA_CDCA14G3867 [Cyanidium caldarium]